MATVLEISGMRKRFGGVVALAGVDLTIKSEEIIGIIGPNGSGKTTLFNTVCGVYTPDGGQVRWNGVEITGRPAFEIGRLGIARTFQQAMSFPALSVRENIQIAMEHGSSGGATAEARRWSSAEELLRFVGLERFADETASVDAFRQPAPPRHRGRSRRQAVATSAR